MLTDLKYAIRALRGTPVFAATAVLTLALGIGANTIIFSLLDAALLRPLPFPHSDRLVRVWSTRNGTSAGGPSPLDMRDFAASAHSFEGLVVYDHWRKNVSGISASRQAEEMVVGLVPGSYFEILGVRPILGRLFTASENQYGKHYVAAIGRNFWHSRFASDPRVLGRTLRINGEPYAIVAVMPDVVPAWMDQVNTPVSVWTPFAFQDIWSEASRGGRGYLSLGRLKPGASYQQARAELATLAARLANDHPVDRGIGATVEPLADTRAGSIRPILLMLASAVGAVLLIVCANLASLLMARNSARHRELAVRAALGAGRARIARQLLIETLLVSFIGGAAGLGIAFAVGAALTRGAGGNLPYATKSAALAQFWGAPDIRVLLFTLGASIATAVLCGITPALIGSRVPLADTLREGGRSGTSGIARRQFQRLLVMVEVGLSLVLVFAAAVLIESVMKLDRRDPGFKADRLLLAHIYVPEARYPDPASIARFCDAFGERMRTLPGIVDASVTTGYPPSIDWQQMFTLTGSAPARAADVPVARFAGVDEHYLRTLGLSLVSGRDFRDTDTPAGPPVAIVNEEFVRRYFAHEDPIGRQIQPGPPPGIPAVPLEDFGSSSRAITIVGVVRNFMNDGPALPPQPQIFALFRQFPGLNFGFKDIVVRAAMDPESVAPAIARELHALDPDIPLGEVRTMRFHMNQQTADTRFTTLLLALFAGLGIVLAVVGVYGAVAYLAAQRTQEFGVRIALGATSADILRLVLRYGLAIGLAGVIVGVAGAILVRGLLAQLLHGISGLDPWMLAAAAVVLLAATAAASAIPARRAMRVDPIRVLRAD